MRQAFLKKVFVRAAENLVVARARYQNMLRGRWLAVTIATRWKNKAKRYGAGVPVYHENRIR